ncbi:MAG: hypothetical protein IT513_17310 [Burkholderiales bacterium]|nr:hypothetical protein [Burkholderiales bacterium]
MAAVSALGIDLRLLLLSAVVCLGIWVRAVDLDKQFTHIDDLGVAESILVQDQLYTPEYVRRRIGDNGHEAYDSVPYRVLRRLDTAGQLENALPALRVMMKAVVVPWVWTYAPFQFPFTSQLLSREQDYRQVLFWGRFPSFLFGCLALVLVVIYFRRVLGDSYFLPSFAAILLNALSWESIAYAKHMSSYAIGVFAVTGLLLALAVAVAAVRPTLRFSVALGFVLAALSHMQYQLLFFLPAFYLAWLAAILRSPADRMFRLRRAAATVAVHAVAILPMVIVFLLHRTERGVTWSNYFSFPILFDPVSEGALFETTGYALNFLAFNGWRITEFLLSFSPDGGVPRAATALLLLLMGAGLTRLLRSEAVADRATGIFVLAAIVTIGILVVMRKLTFGPTRHSLVFLPVLAVLASYGVAAIVDRLRFLRSSGGEVALAAAMLAGGLAAFAPGFPDALARRRDLFEESEFRALAEKYQPAFVVSAAAGNLAMMAPYKTWAREFSPGARSFTLFRNPARAERDTYMLVNFRPFTVQNLDTIHRAFGLAPDVGRPGAESILYRREQDTGACIDVFVEKREGENSIWILVARSAAGAKPRAGGLGG